MTKIIFVGNYKGGVGKTTTLFNLASRLSESNKSSLLIDLDPQSSLSEICIKKYSSQKKELINLKPEETLNYIYDLNLQNIDHNHNLSLDFNLNNLIKKLNPEDSQCNVHFIPSSLYYPNYLTTEESSNVENRLFNDDKLLLGLDKLSLYMSDSIEYLSIFKCFLNSIINFREFDYIFIDCPPSNNLITQSAFLSSDYYLIPTILDGLSTNGVVHYIKTINNTYDNFCVGNARNNLYNKHIFGDRPTLIGIVSTMFRKTVNYNQEEANFNRLIRKETPNISHIGDLFFFNSVINDYIEVARTMYLGEHSVDIKPTQTINDFDSFSKEFLERLEDI